VYRLWATKSAGVGVIVRAISFQDFQAMSDRVSVGMKSCKIVFLWGSSYSRVQTLLLQA